MNEVNIGDYVLATRWNDGDPRDPFCVGFVSEVFETWCNIVDKDGVRFPGTYRRVEHISEQRGWLLVANIKYIEQGVRSAWWWKRAARSQFPIQENLV